MPGTCPRVSRPAGAAGLLLSDAEEWRELRPPEADCAVPHHSGRVFSYGGPELLTVVGGVMRFYSLAVTDRLLNDLRRGDFHPMVVSRRRWQRARDGDIGRERIGVTSGRRSAVRV